jgi:uncharacterized protein YceK
MSKLVIAIAIAMLSGCSTVAGTVRGLGEDVGAGTATVANWIKPATPAK